MEKNSDPGFGIENIRIRDGKNSDPGSGINNPDPQHWFLGFFLVVRSPKEKVPLDFVNHLVLYKHEKKEEKKLGFGRQLGAYGVLGEYYTRSIQRIRKARLEFDTMKAYNFGQSRSIFVVNTKQIIPTSS
jgi:hypothetical protein